MSRIVLIACGKAKAAEACAARDLYTGALFRDRLAYAERSGDPWWIVSAKFGLLNPDQEISPYDLTLRTLPEVERAAWSLQTISRVLDELPDDVRLRSVHLELHMGADYADRLYDVALAAGLAVSRPLKGLGVGQQRAWYAARAKRRA